MTQAESIAAVRRSLQQSRFMLGAAAAKQFPADSGLEIAFAGRSNVGKSSAINLLTSQGSLARVSKTPGRTQQINFFAIDDQRRLVDLPGYGFAKVPPSVQAEWKKLMGAYFENRQSLVGVVVVMDARRPLTELDTIMLDWCSQAGVAAHILLNKADKLGRSEQSATLANVQRTLKARGDVATIDVQLFSAHNCSGLEQAWLKIYDWLFGELN